VAPETNRLDRETEDDAMFVLSSVSIGGRQWWHKCQKAGIDLFVEEANASGGVLGKKLELIVRDSALKSDNWEPILVFSDNWQLITTANLNAYTASFHLA
jgi:hypothetical protein